MTTSLRQHRRGAALIFFAAALPSPGCECNPLPAPVAEGAEGPGEGEQPEPDPRAPVCPADELREPPASLCPNARAIVPVDDNGNCQDWSGSGWVFHNTGTHCIYVRLGKTTPVAEIADREQFRVLEHQLLEKNEDGLSQLLGGAQVEYDCMLFPSAPPEDELSAARQPLAKEFLGAIALDEAPPRHPVTVAIIDTAPTQTAMGLAMHGKLMAGIVQQVGGDADANKIHVVTYPGLPRDREGKADLQHGGYYGFQSDVAFAIDDAVAGWTLASRSGEQVGPLIINLSVGWEPIAAANSSLVAAAIARARCAGALVFAATGNHHPRTCVEGPTGPATFAAWPAPTSSQCDDMAKDPRWFELAPSSTPPSEPLVHAVSGVDRFGRPLALNRPGTNAPLAALGVGAVVPFEGRLLGPMTGTSVGTALMSGMAARLWSQSPDTDADAIVGLLWEKGAPSSVAVDPEVAYASWTTQRIIGFVPAEPASAPAPLDTPTAAEPADGWEELECKFCDLNETLRWPSGTSFVETPQMAWTIPQPDDVLCPICGIDGDKLHVSMSLAYGSTTKDVRITLRESSSSETISLGPQTIPYEPNAPLVLTNAELCTVGRTNRSPTSAYIEFVYSATDATGATYHYSVGNSIRVGAPCAG
ncbi:S8/S53 family peptidase [Nannocystaceae bacterium ST9]